MGRQKDSSCNSYKKIHEALKSGPKCPTELHNLTHLNPNTVASRLKYLAEKDMVTSHREGRKVIYEIKKTRSPYGGWEIPWIDLMMNREDWKKKWKQIDEEIASFRLQREKNSSLLNKYGQFSEFLEIPINKELLEGFEKAGIDWKSKTLIELRNILRKNFRTPICLECLQKYKYPEYSKFYPETGEYICPKCNVVVEKEFFEIPRPARKRLHRYRLLEKMRMRISRDPKNLDWQ